MSTNEQKVGRRVRWGYVVAIAFVLMCIWALVSIAGMFRLGSDAAALRNSVMRDLGGTCEQKIAFRAGFLTTGLIRMGAKAVKLEAEPRAAIQSLRGAEVGVYSLACEPASINCARILADADKVMVARGWERIVGVSKDGKLVAVFGSQSSGSREMLKLCVLVLDERNLVVVSGKGEVKPLVELAMRRMRRETRLNELKS
jgi:hypothetical protein